MKKKILTIMMTLSLLIVNIGIVFAVTTDVTAPTVNKLTFEESSSLKPGDKVYLNTDMKDDVSGIETVHIWVNRILINNDKYYDNIEEVSQGLEVHFDEEKPYVIIPETYRSGSYYVSEIDMYDKEDNRSWFYTTDQLQYFKEWYDYLSTGTAGAILNEGTTFDSWVDNLTANYEPVRTNISIKFTVEAGTEDTESPFMSSIGEIPETVNYSDSIKFEFKVSDNNHKMDISIGFSNGVGMQKYGFDDTNSSIVDFEYNPYQYQQMGVTYLDYVIITDLYGNTAFYLREGYNGDLAVDYYQGICKVCETLPEIKFEILDDGTLDNTPPTLVDVKINKEKFPIPSFAKIELEATDDKALAEEAYVTFKSGKKELNTILYLEEDGKYRGELNINQYAELGEYKLTDVVISDAAGNGLIYSNYEHKYKEKDLTIDLGFELTSKFKADITTSTISKDLIDIINNAEDDSNIAIDATGNTIIKKEVFEAIKGTNKTIYIESNGIEWIFNGQDIKEPKDIDVSLMVYYDYAYTELDTEKYDGKALILEFAPNGDLPGIATVRVKLDYTLRTYIGEEVYVYYYDNESESTKVFSDVIGKSISLNDNGWFEFKISHNSAYIFTNTKPNEEYIKKEESTIQVNEETTTKEDKKENKSNLKTIIIIVISAVVVIALGIIIFFIIKNKKKNIA